MAHACLCTINAKLRPRRRMGRADAECCLSALCGIASSRAFLRKQQGGGGGVGYGKDRLRLAAEQVRPGQVAAPEPPAQCGRGRAFQAPAQRPARHGPAGAAKGHERRENARKSKQAESADPPCDSSRCGLAHDALQHRDATRRCCCPSSFRPTAGISRSGCSACSIDEAGAPGLCCSETCCMKPG